MVLTSVPEGTVVEVVAGPLTADDASIWYGVIALDQQGVLPATLLIPGAGTTEETATGDDSAEAEGDVATEGEVAPPVPTGEIATIAGTNDEGARCRTEPTYEAEVIIVLYEGEAVELTGPASEEWQPLICAGVQGYVHNDFVLLEGESPLEPAPVEEVPVEEVPTEEIPVEEVPVTEAPVEEVPVEEAPVTEVPVVEEPVDEVPTEDVPVEDVPVEEEPVVEAPAEEVPTEETPVTEPEPSEVVETPVAEEPTEEATEVPTEEPTEVPTEEAETPIATEEPVEAETPVATEEPTEEATEVPTAEPTPVPTVAVPEIEAEQAADIQQTFTAAVDTSASDATGYAVVVGTNGDGVRCRASRSNSAATITVLPEGSEVALRGAPKGAWTPVICANSDGFVVSDYLATSDGSGDITAAVGSDGEFTAAAITGTAVVSGTDGGGLRCRSSASYSGTVITVLPEGSKVNLNGTAQGEWQPIICGGKNGFAHVDFLTKSASSSKSNVSAAAQDGVGSTGSAKVTGTNGDGVRCRSSASYSGNIITVLAEGATVTLRGATQGEWTPVTCAGKSGFVHKDYLTKTSGGTSGGSTSGGSTSAASNGTAKVTGTGGGGLNCRATASSSGTVLMVLSEGATVTLRGAAQGTWQPIVCGGKNGFASTAFLTKSSGGSTSGGSTSGGSTSGGGGSTSGFAIGSRVVTTSSLNLRYEPSMSSGVAAVAPSGTVVKVTGNRQGFTAVSWDGLKGWMKSDFLSPTNAALSQRGGSGTPTNPGTAPTNPAPSGSRSGQAIVDFAMKYVGYPYVWAGEGPYGFDCSGFTMFVIKNVLGINITHDMFVQYDMGAPVSRNALQPGDIVFFQNTFRWGMSHTGIYMGGGQFVHAENETTGVRVSDINSQYYSSRYYGAVRFS